MSVLDLTPERRNELTQWASLGLSPMHLSRMYGVSPHTVWRLRRKQKGGKALPPGRYPAVAAETVEAILAELRKDSSRGRRKELACRFGLAPSTVSRIASRAGDIPKGPAGRKSRHNRKTMDRLAEYFADE